MLINDTQTILKLVKTTHWPTSSSRGSQISSLNLSSFRLLFNKFTLHNRAQNGTAKELTSTLDLRLV